MEIINVEIEELDDGSKLIYNIYSGIFGIMDKKTQEIFDSIGNGNLETDDLSDDYQNTINVMSRARYIIDADFDELAHIKLERSKDRYFRNTLHLTIAPTMDCNMRCPYCYESDKVRDIVMSDETQEDILNFIRFHTEKNTMIKRVRVCWYGGEPLMQKEIIYKLSKKIMEICEEKGLKYEPSMLITNGSLLDVQTAKKLAEDCNVTNVQITIDGMKELHNKRRILASGDDSYSIIMANIEACKDFFNIVVRVNVDNENTDEVKTLINHFVNEKGWGTSPYFYLAPVLVDGSSCGSDWVMCMSGDEFAEISNTVNRINYSLNRDMVARHFFPRSRKVSCGAECLENFVIDPEGYLYTCFQKIRIEDHCVGHVKKPFLINEAYGKWILSELQEKCTKCEYLPMCQGGCAFEKIRGGEPRCYHTLYTYKNNLKLAYEDYLLQKSNNA